MKTIIIPIEFILNKGGVQQSVASLIKGLSMTGRYKIIVISPKNSEFSKLEFSHDVVNITTEQDNWNISKTHFISSYIIALDIYKRIKPYLNSETLFLTNHTGASYIVSLLPIWKINEVYVNRGGDFNSKGFGDVFMKLKIKTHRIRTAVAISKKQRDVLVSIGMFKDRVFVIPNGLNLPETLYNYRELNKNELRISTIGYLSKIKGQHIGVQLIKRLRDIGVNAKLNLYGIPDDDMVYNNMLNEMISQLGVEQFVYKRGFVKGEELFSKTDILISFSNREGFGRTLVEGMLRNIPVIAYRGAGGPLEITDNGKYGYLVDVNDANHYFNLIMKMLINPIDVENNVKASYNYALSRFTEKVMVDNYDRLFQSL